MAHQMEERGMSKEMNIFEAGLNGTRNEMPNAYSAVKVEGKNRTLIRKIALRGTKGKTNYF